MRIIAAEATGGADYWYVRADFPIKSLADIGGKTIAYSTNGASTHTLVLAFMAKSGAAAKPVATGGPAPTFTQVMSGQIDVGWSAPPFGLDAAAENKIRIIARAGDVDAGRDQTIRSLITTAPKLAEKPDVFRRFLAAYRETIDWMYAGDTAIAPYAAIRGSDRPRSRAARATSSSPSDALARQDQRPRRADAGRREVQVSGRAAERPRNLVRRFRFLGIDL